MGGIGYRWNLAIIKTLKKERSMADMELKWNPKEDMAILISDQTGATRKIEDICKMLDEIQKTVHKYGFDLKNWGSGARMYHHMGELYEKK